MQLVRMLAPVALALAFAGGTAAAEEKDPPKCTITKIKAADVTIDVPLRGKLTTALHCRVDAIAAAREYAKANPVCDPTKKLEKVFKFVLEFGTRAKHETLNLSASCPKSS